MIYIEYLWSLLRHKWYVIRAGLVLNVPLWRLIVHDLSKFSRTEFGRYARWHFGNVKNKPEWSIAWHHHLRLNSHHPEHWLLSWRGDDPNFYDGIGEMVSDCVVVLPMPEICVREMIADLLGASRVYTGSWDIAVWINENGPKWNIHSVTLDHIWTVMLELDYFITDNCEWSWMAGDKTRALFRSRV